jgi:hypothetical protein
MSKIKVKHYYPCNYPLLKAIVKSGTISVPRTYFLDMAKELCEFYGESFDAFVDSANGTRLLNDGIDNCYDNLWLSPATKFNSAKTTIDKFEDTSDKIYRKIIAWIARVKKCKITDIPLENDIYIKYVSGTQDIKKYYYISCPLLVGKIEETVASFDKATFVLWIDEEGNSGAYDLNEIRNLVNT